MMTDLGYTAYISDESKTTTITTGILHITKGFNDLYLGMERNIITIAVGLILVLALPFLLLAFLIGIAIPTILLNQTMKKGLIILKKTEIKTEEDYMDFKKSYLIWDKLSKNAVTVNDLPYFIQFMFKSYVTHINIIKEIRTELAEKLYILPKGLSEEQMTEAANLNKGIEVFCDDDEYDYAKGLALGEIEFIER